MKKFRDAVQVNPKLKDRPELDALRKALLKEPLEFFRQLRDQLQADSDTRPETLARLADANFDLAYTTAEIGSIPDAIRSYAESITILERLVRENPTVAAYQRDLAASCNNVAALLNASGHMAEATELYQRVLTINKRLACEHPTVAEYQKGIAHAYNNISLLLRDMGHAAEALESQQRALAIREQLGTRASRRRSLSARPGREPP